VLRRYKTVEIYDLKQEESYIIDDEAYSLLQLIDGTTTIEAIVNQYEKDKKEEALEAIEQFNELDIVKVSEEIINDSSSLSKQHISIPDENPFEPPYLKNLMINITERCNLTCKHCYITDKNQKDMNFEKLLGLIRKFHELQGIRLILTGGEPFLYDNIKSLLQELVHIPLQKVLLTNGILIPQQKPEIMELLKKNQFEVFVSLDGLQSSHNELRNSECFQETIDGIKRLLEYDITVSINTMVHGRNFEEFEEMSQFLRSLGKIKNWAIDVPTFDEQIPQTVREMYEISPEKGGEILRNYGWGVMVESGLGEQGLNLACGPNLMAIDVVGRVTKCGFFTDLSPGNVFDLGLKESWEFIQKEANWDIGDLKCAELECEFLNDCRGGCRFRAFHCSDEVTGIDPYKCGQYNRKIKNKAKEIEKKREFDEDSEK
jgi:radical SAM protein with 4Fe4S-binding SPASM domain